MRFKSFTRKALALALLAVLAAVARFTMSAGRPTWLVLILLAGFALRILLTPGVRDSQNTSDSRYDSGE